MAEGVDCSELSNQLEECGRIHGVEMTAHAGSTDCNIPLSMGIPSIMVPCGMGAGAHTRGEYIEIDSMVPGIKFATAMVMHHF